MTALLSGKLIYTSQEQKLYLYVGNKKKWQMFDYLLEIETFCPRSSSCAGGLPHTKDFHQPLWILSGLILDIFNLFSSYQVLSFSIFQLHKGNRKVGDKIYNIQFPVLSSWWYVCCSYRRIEQQDHQWWRYHRRLLDYQNPYFQLIIK